MGANRIVTGSKGSFGSVMKFESFAAAIKREGFLRESFQSAVEDEQNYKVAGMSRLKDCTLNGEPVQVFEKF